MPIQVNEQSAIGVLVVPTLKKYKIKGRINRKTKVLKITTCHREIIIKDPKSKFEIMYYPVSEIENTGYCPIDIAAFDEVGQHSWAFIDFHRDEQLVGQIGCNGGMEKSIGVSVCQSRTGLIQQIQFAEPIQEVEHPDRCGEPWTEDQLLFQYVIEPERCMYVFETGEGDTRRHRLLTLGYDNVLLR